MRIQHNIPAMSSYRNYTNNTSALSKNLEKLSSGYKINRAGDDAAGLAISEKMRAQISGLEQAQSNAKSGINLVQTAEGALTEVHDMLNRMVTLAEQSANGTYDNEVDRVQLQKEVDQLKSEINRIADSANFNGIKLLDGSMDANGKVSNTTTIFSGLKASSNVKGTKVLEGALKDFGGSNPKGSLALTGSDMATKDATSGTGEIDESDISVRYHQDAKGAGKTTFTVDLDGANFKTDAGDTLTGLIFGLDSNTMPNGATGTGPKNNCLFTGKTGDTKLTYDVTAGNNGITSEDIAKAIQEAIDKNDGKVYLETGGDTKRVEYTVTRDGDKLRFTMTDDGYNDAVDYTNTYNETDANKNNQDKLNYFQGNFNFSLNYEAAPTGTSDAEKLEKAFMDAVGKAQHCSTSNINEGNVSSGTIYAEALIRFDQSAADTTGGFNKVTDVIKDGAGLQIGDDYYIFAKTDEVFNTEYADNVHVVDIRDLDKLTDAKLKATAGTQDRIDADNDLRTALDRLSIAAKDNEMFDVQVVKAGNAIALTERSTYTGDANLTAKDFGLESQIRTFDSATSTTTVTKEAGKSLTLQIGDTAESFNQMKVNIGDMHTDSMGIGDIDISTQSGAAEAMGKIKDAINYVSDVRGTLGATQNRLDHTINNLAVMQQNIQDAESTIRDVDIAAEMMNYTKNSILVQSAQAMLAQANQMPQGVLQLLQ